MSGRPSRLGELDLYLIGEGRHFDLADRLGAHVTDGGTNLAVWAPDAVAVAVIGDRTGWHSVGEPLAPVANSGVWEGFVAGMGDGDHYRFRITTRRGEVIEKADPLAFATDPPPGTASVVHTLRHQWGDDAWQRARAARNPLDHRMSIYELHLGSWRRSPDDSGREQLSRDGRGAGRVRQ